MHASVNAAIHRSAPLGGCGVPSVNKMPMILPTLVSHTIGQQPFQKCSRGKPRSTLESLSALQQFAPSDSAYDTDFVPPRLRMESRGLPCALS
jgi:hypothetical protein